MTDHLCDVVISVDSHLGESRDFVSRLPKAYRDRFPLFDYNANGERWPKGCDRPSEKDMALEFRSDAKLGTDIERRLRDMARDGTDAEVIFPNQGLACSLGTEPGEYYQAWSHAYNDYAWEVFSGHRERFKVAALLAVDDIDATLSEARQRIEQGFCTLFLPTTVPWQPYRLALYDPLWRLAQETGVSVNFHTFSGNLGNRADIASVGELDPARYEKARQLLRDEWEAGPQLLTYVLGALAGMAPIVELIGAGVLDRFPALKFVVTESEAGWLPWVLQFMDQIQTRCHLLVPKLELKPSEYFRRQGTAAIMDDSIALDHIERIGADNLMWGNDYPHDEGTFLQSSEPIAQIRRRLSATDAHKVLSANAAALYGFDLDYLAAQRTEVTRHLP